MKCTCVFTVDAAKKRVYATLASFRIQIWPNQIQSQILLFAKTRGDRKCCLYTLLQVFYIKYELRSISSFRSSIKRNQSKITFQESYSIDLSHPFPILHILRQVCSISAICVAGLQFHLKLHPCPCSFTVFSISW